MIKHKKQIGILCIILLAISVFGVGCSNTATQTISTSNENTIEQAVINYANNIPTVGDSYKISESKAWEELQNNPQKYVVIDIRQASAYAAGHIATAVNVPFGSDIADNLDKIRAYSKGKTALVCCYTGQTAGQTVALFNIAGINSRSINFGMGGTPDEPVNGWVGFKFPVTTDVTKLPSVEEQASDNDINEAVKSYFRNIPRDSRKISVATLNLQLNNIPDEYMIIDIRNAQDFANGHIENAINIPYGPDIAKKLPEIKEKSQGKILIVSCYTGQTSAQITAILNLTGINTTSLGYGAGKGINKGWITEGYKIVTN